MDELLNLKEYDGKVVVSARGLHSYLWSHTDFTNWCKRMFEYDFIEGVDYILAKNGENKFSKSNPKDYALTIECAKEIAMLQRTPRGKEARLYFIECERKLLSVSEDEMILRSMIALQTRVETMRLELTNAKEIIEQQAPKVRYVDEVLAAPNLISTTIIAKELHMSAIELNRLLNRKGIIYRAGATWVPYAKYQDMGLMQTKTHIYTDRDGNEKTAVQNFWTQTGREFIHGLFNQSLRTA